MSVIRIYTQKEVKMYKYRGNENILSEKKVQMKQGQYRGVKYFSSNEKKLENVNYRKLYRGQTQ